MSDVTVQLFIDLFLGRNCSQVVQAGKYTGQILDTGNGVVFCSVRNQVKSSAQHGNLGTAYMVQVLIHIQKPMAQNIAVMLVQTKEIIVLLQIQLHCKKFAAVLAICPVV